MNEQKVAVLDTNIPIRGIVASAYPYADIISSVEHGRVLMCTTEAVKKEYRLQFRQNTIGYRKNSPNLPITGDHRDRLEALLSYSLPVLFSNLTGKLSEIAEPADPLDKKFLIAADEAVGSTGKNCYLVSEDHHILDMAGALQAINIIALNGNDFYSLIR